VKDGQKLGDGMHGTWPVDDDAERAALVMLRQQNDNVIEFRLTQVRRGNKELTGERGRSGGVRCGR
jgi:hypothetical protein